MMNLLDAAVLVDGSHGLHPADDDEPVAVVAPQHHDTPAETDGERHANASDAELDFNERRTNEIGHREPPMDLRPSVGG